MSVTIFDLPAEMIAHIFSFVSHKKDRRNLALICKQFHKIVRQQSKMHNRLNLLRDQKVFPMSFFEQSDEFPFQKISLCTKDIEQYKGLWQKHGAEITEIAFSCNWNDFGTFGNEFNELFPSINNLVLGASEFRSMEVKHFFSENIKYLELCFDDEDEEWKDLGSILELFPGLNYLNLTIQTADNQNDSEVQEFKDTLDKWLPQLEKIEFSFDTFDDVQLLEAFEGLIDEKLNFKNLTVMLTQKSINILKNFFSVSRHVESLEIYEPNAVPDSTFCALIEQNARIDRLTLFIHDDEEDGYLARLRYLINAPGVKEINVNGCYGGRVFLDDCIHFTPEALLKVKEIAVRIEDDQSVLMIPLFRNLRQLSVSGGVVGNDELAFIVNNFPHLEYLAIPGLDATNGRLLTRLKSIRNLAIGRSPSVLDAFFKFGDQFPNLETLYLSGMPNITCNGVKSIVANCPRIREIEFNKCPKISEKCLDFVAQKLFYAEKISSDFNDEIRHNLEKKYPELKFHTSYDWMMY